MPADEEAGSDIPTYTFTFDDEPNGEGREKDRPKFGQYLNEWRDRKRLEIAEQYVQNAPDDWILAYSKLAGELEKKSVARTAIAKERAEAPTETPNYVKAISEFTNAKFLLDYFGKENGLSQDQIDVYLEIEWQKVEQLIPQPERSEQLEEVLEWLKKKAFAGNISIVDPRAIDNDDLRQKTAALVNEMAAPYALGGLAD